MVDVDEIRMSIEIRQDDSRQSPGRIFGEMLTYGRRARDRAEVFEPDSLTWPEDGIVLNRQHERRNPIMRFVPEVRDGKVVIDAPLPDTQAGRDTATEIRGGLFRGLSIEFRATAQRYVSGVRRISRATLTGLAVVDEGSHHTAVEVRGAQLPGGIIGWL